MVLKTDGTKIFNDIGSTSSVLPVRSAYYRFGNTYWGEYLDIPSTIGKNEIYKYTYVRPKIGAQKFSIKNRHFSVENYSSYPKMINLMSYVECISDVDDSTGITYKILYLPFILGPNSRVILVNPDTPSTDYEDGYGIITLAAMPVTVPNATSTPSSDHSASSAVNVSTIISGSDKIVHIDLDSDNTSEYALRNTGRTDKKIPYVTGWDNSYAHLQKEAWYTDSYYRSSIDVEPFRATNITHSGYNMYQIMSSCSLGGDDIRSSNLAKVKDEAIAFPWTTHYSCQMHMATFDFAVEGGWNTKQWGKKYLKITSQACDNTTNYPDGYYNCPSVVYDSNGNVTSDDYSLAQRKPHPAPLPLEGGQGVTFFFPLTDMNDGHLGSAYIVTEITE